jgi:hypothetical protein
MPEVVNKKKSINNLTQIIIDSIHTQKIEDKNIKAFKGKRRKNEYLFIGVLKMQNEGTWTLGN